MGEIILKIPKGLPLPPLKKKLDQIVREEEVRWALFYKSREELVIAIEELKELDEIRDKIWKEEKKRYDL